MFFPRLYRDLNQVGKAFAVASCAVFLYIVLSVVFTYAVPFVRDTLDTPDPEHQTEKLLFTAACAVFYAAATVLSVRVSIKRFEQMDLQL